MRAVIDTCVIVDALQSREPFCKDAQSIFLLCANRQFEGFLTAKAITDIYYLTHRQTHSGQNTDGNMSRSYKKQNAARNGGICGRSFRLIFTCFGQQLYELCRGVHGDRRFAVILRVPRHDAVHAGAHRRLDHHGILEIGNLR